METNLESNPIECRGCEAKYSINQGEDFLIERAGYCPFCGEWLPDEEAYDPHYE